MPHRRLTLAAFARPAALAVFAAAAATAPALAQPNLPAPVYPPPQNVLQLSASATVEVPRDWLSVTLAVTREAADAATVQAQLSAALDAALADARRAVRPGQLELRTGGFNINPRYVQRPAAAPAVAGWQGTAELVVEGRDSAAITQLAGRLAPLAVARLGFTLSREAREKVEGEVAASAIARFRAQADAYARQFGFAGYTIREVTVSAGGDDPSPPIPRMRMAAASAEMAVPVEAGRASVTATVSGSVQMSIR